MLHPLGLRIVRARGDEVRREQPRDAVRATGGARYDALTLDSLRLFLHEDSPPLLYHHLLRHVKHATAWGDEDDTPVTLSIRPVGFAREDAVLPLPDGVPQATGCCRSTSSPVRVRGPRRPRKLAGAQVKSRFTVRIVFDTAFRRRRCA